MADDDHPRDNSTTCSRTEAREPKSSSKSYAHLCRANEFSAISLRTNKERVSRSLNDLFGICIRFICSHLPTIIENVWVSVALSFSCLFVISRCFRDGRRYFPFNMVVVFVGYSALLFHSHATQKRAVSNCSNSCVRFVCRSPCIT